MAQAPEPHNYHFQLLIIAFSLYMIMMQGCTDRSSERIVDRLDRINTSIESMN